MDPSAKYKLLEQVGNGSFGVVYKAVNKETGEVVAIKEVNDCKMEWKLMDRLIWRVGMMILLKFSRRLRCSVDAIVRMLRSIMVCLPFDVADFQGVS